MKLDDVKLFGDALWYTYDYEIISPQEHLVGRGMSNVQKDRHPLAHPQHAQFTPRTCGIRKSVVVLRGTSMNGAASCSE
jgi:hypothetical protein